MKNDVFCMQGMKNDTLLFSQPEICADFYIVAKKGEKSKLRLVWISEELT